MQRRQLRRRQLRVPKGSKVMYKFLDTVEVTMSEGNVVCDGGDLKIGGKKHSNIEEFVTIKYQVLTVEVTETNGRLKTTRGPCPRHVPWHRGDAP